jgi:hypothetical protein
MLYWLTADRMQSPRDILPLSPSSLQLSATQRFVSAAQRFVSAGLNLLMVARLFYIGWSQSVVGCPAISISYPLQCVD